MKPWMSDIEIAKIHEYLNPNQLFFEWGSGGSTLHFSKFVKQYISVEYDIRWYSAIKHTILSKQLNNISYLYCKPNNPIIFPVWRGNIDDFASYINIVDTINIKKYDIVLIDGRCRVACAKKILNFIDNNSIVFVHDFMQRSRYQSILEYYELIDSVAGEQSLGVFKKKSNVL